MKAMTPCQHRQAPRLSYSLQLYFVVLYKFQMFYGPLLLRQTAIGRSISEAAQKNNGHSFIGEGIWYVIWLMQENRANGSFHSFPENVALREKQLPT